MSEPKVTRRTLASYKPHPHNPNRHTERGLQIVEDSVNFNGAGRSGLAANDGTLLAGNGTWEAMAAAGIEEVIEVETDGHQWVIVKRADLAPDDARAKALMISDNRSSELGLDNDTAMLTALLKDIEAESEYLLKGAGYQQWELQQLLDPQLPNDPRDEWQGMPEFENEDVSAAYTVKVHFHTEADIQAFAQLVGQVVTPQTKWIYYPKQQPEDLKKYKVIDES